VVGLIDPKEMYERHIAAAVAVVIVLFAPVLCAGTPNIVRLRVRSAMKSERMGDGWRRRIRARYATRVHELAGAYCVEAALWTATYLPFDLSPRPYTMPPEARLIPPVATVPGRGRQSRCACVLSSQRWGWVAARRACFRVNVPIAPGAGIVASVSHARESTDRSSRCCA